MPLRLERLAHIHAKSDAEVSPSDFNGIATALAHRYPPKTSPVGRSQNAEDITSVCAIYPPRRPNLPTSDQAYWKGGPGIGSVPGFVVFLTGADVSELGFADEGYREVIACLAD